MDQRQKIKVHGHRGCRAYYPENTIEAFKYAVDLGVDFLEMDITITKDEKVVLSHEPWLSHKKCLNPEGELIGKSESKTKYNLYKMDYAEIAKCNTGAMPNPKFPQQRKINTFKPLLDDVIEAIEAYVQFKKTKPVGYNIEVKRFKGGDDIFHPRPVEYVELMKATLLKYKFNERIIIQSFDDEIMEEVSKKLNLLTKILLIDKLENPFKKISAIKFAIDGIGPHYSLVTEKLVAFCKEKKLLICPWTVNKPVEIKRLINLNINGIISDYPDFVTNEL